MPEHRMGLQLKYFEKIASGEKTVECRLFDEKREMIKVGDLIEFKNSKNQNIIKTKVIEVIRSKTFSRLIDQVGLAAVGASDKKTFLAELNQFYSADQERELGVLGIKIKIL